MLLYLVLGNSERGEEGREKGEQHKDAFMKHDL